MAKSKVPTIDLRSGEVILAYVDERGRSARNAPARDLTHNDIARLAYREALAEVANDVGQPIDRTNPDGPKYERPDHKTVDQARAGAIYADLVDSGYFSPDIPPPATEPAPAPEPTPVPAAPAEPEA
jgi:hypothetical protein